jgi:hypothetical protein
VYDCISALNISLRIRLRTIVQNRSIFKDPGTEIITEVSVLDYILLCGKAFKQATREMMNMEMKQNVKVLVLLRIFMTYSFYFFGNTLQICNFLKFLPFPPPDDNHAVCGWTLCCKQPARFTGPPALTCMRSLLLLIAEKSSGYFSKTTLSVLSSKHVSPTKPPVIVTDTLFSTTSDPYASEPVMLSAAAYGSIPRILSENS